MESYTRICVWLVGVLFPLSGIAQTAINGTVTDVSGEPVIGATILQQGTSNGTITDFDGNFSLQVPEGAMLEISYVGYASQTLAAATGMKVVLKEDTEVLEEVVVVGYGVQKKSDLTGSIAQVNDKDLQKMPAPSLGAALEGRAAGLQVTGSGAPGSNVSLNIRGIGSINNSQPLIVIDGVPTDVPLNMINMDDVASIDVLKDASATAIYGSRGAYGVVIITTKKGENEKGHISLKGSFGFDQIQRTLPLLSASQFASLHNEMMSAAGQPQYTAYADPTALGEGTDWLSQLWQFAPTQNYALSYSGGTQKSNFYVSGAYFDQRGIVKTTDYKRITLQFNHDTQLFNWLRF
jgi:TonB-linked SusC/RagA family outer membrane protein